MSNYPRVAFFTDSFHDVNGVAHTSRQLDGFARRTGRPLLSVHAGPQTSWANHTLELQRSDARILLDDGLAFDPLLFRHMPLVERAVREFQPDVIHITGPGDLGWLGLIAHWRLGIPVVASWHTNLHEYAARRFPLPAMARPVQDLCWQSLMLFYRIAERCLAPNEELRSLIEVQAKTPTALMERGIDTELFTPARRRRSDETVVLGYVGRLRPEKNVQLLAQVEQALRAAGHTNYRFLIVGDGSQREWLKNNLHQAELPGVLKGGPLADAYASMDVFLFPSTTDTYGNVIAEALASGVPAIVTSSGGPKFLVRDGETGFVAATDAQFAQRAVEMVAGQHPLPPMRAAARAWAEGRTWDAVFEGVWDCYRAAAGASIAACPPRFAPASSKVR